MFFYGTLNGNMNMLRKSIYRLQKHMDVFEPFCRFVPDVLLGLIGKVSALNYIMKNINFPYIPFLIHIYIFWTQSIQFLISNWYSTVYNIKLFRPLCFFIVRTLSLYVKRGHVDNNNRGNSERNELVGEANRLSISRTICQRCNVSLLFYYSESGRVCEYHTLTLQNFAKSQLVLAQSIISLLRIDLSTEYNIHSSGSFRS